MRGVVNSELTDEEIAHDAQDEFEAELDEDHFATDSDNDPNTRVW